MTTQWSLSQGVRSCSRSHVRLAKRGPETCRGIRAFGPRWRALRSLRPSVAREGGIPMQFIGVLCTECSLHEAHARPRRDARSGEDAGPRDAAHARHSPSRRFFRVSPAPRRAPSPATTHFARATASLGPKARAALRRRTLRAHDTAKREGRCVFTQANPFQYAEEVTRGESRAAAVISESIGIPPHLSLPPFRCPALSASRTASTDSIEQRSIAERRSMKRLIT